MMESIANAMLALGSSTVLAAAIVAIFYPDILLLKIAAAGALVMFASYPVHWFGR